MQATGAVPASDEASVSALISALASASVSLLPLQWRGCCTLVSLSASMSAVGVAVAVGVGVGVGAPDCAQYLPPVLTVTGTVAIHPRRSFHCRSRLPCDSLGAAGALVVLVAVQLSVPGLYLPPVFEDAVGISSAPDDHFTAGPDCRVTVSGSRARWWCWWLSNCPCWDCISRRCSNSWRHLHPPQTIISLPVQTAV